MTNPFPTAQAPTFEAALRPSDLSDWLDQQARDLTHPTLVENELRGRGWHPVQAAIEAARYRQRFNEHPLGYAALMVSTGLAALAVGSAGHVLVSGLDQGVNRDRLSWWLTILLVSLPFAIWSHVWAAHADRDDPVAVWSEPRRFLAQLLLWGCGLVGIARLAWYVGQLVGAVVGATWAAGNSVATSALNVALTISIALPLGLWAFRFGHRFDAENPLRASAEQQRRPGTRPGRRTGFGR